MPFFHKQWGEFIAKSEIATFDPNEDFLPDWKFKPGWLDAIRDKEWGCLDINGKYLKETTSWNGRQNDPQDDYEVTVYRVGKHAAGHLLDGQEWNQFPDAAILEPA